MRLNQQRLIFDCSFENAMTHREINETAEQLRNCYARNRRNREPYVLHFCNLNRSVRSFPLVISNISLSCSIYIVFNIFIVTGCTMA